jgi:hypothetical protein
VCQERGPFSLVSTIEELLGRKSSGFGLENRDYGHRNPSRRPCGGGGGGGVAVEALCYKADDAGSRSDELN